MLNFLYKVSLITRVKTTNIKVGRKYANYERCLQLFDIEHIILSTLLFFPIFTTFWRLKH